MPYQVAPGDPLWTLDTVEFEKQAALFFKGQAVTSEEGKNALIDGATQALLNAMSRTFFKCVKWGQGIV